MFRLPLGIAVATRITLGDIAGQKQQAQ